MIKNHLKDENEGSDIAIIIRELLEHTNSQRQVIKQKYQAMYGKRLEDDVKCALKGLSQEIVIALLSPRLNYEASLLRNVIQVDYQNKKIQIKTKVL